MVEISTEIQKAYDEGFRTGYWHGQNNSASYEAGCGSMKTFERDLEAEWNDSEAKQFVDTHVDGIIKN